MNYKKLFKKCLFASVLVVPNLSAIELEHHIGTELEVPYFEETFKTERGSPEIYFGKNDPNCTKDCNKALSFNGKGNLTFSKSASLVASARYSDRSFAIVKEDVDDSYSNRFYFISSLSYNKYSSYLTLFDICSALSKGITARGSLVCLSDDEIKIYQKPKGSDKKISTKRIQTIELPAEANIGIINNNLSGDIAIAMINVEQQTLYYTELHHLMAKDGNISAWSSHETLIHDRSDYRDVLAVYPKNSTQGVVSAYEYVNVLNKNTTVYDIDGKTVNRRIITNNITGNFGFEPEVFIKNEQVYLTALSSEDERFYTYLLDNKDLKGQENFYSEHADQSIIDLLAGYSVTYNNWGMSQNAGEDIKTEYEIDPSLLHSVYVQARISDTQVTIKYLTDELENNTPESANYLTGLLDFNGFFEGADTLRLKIDWAKINGVATYKSESYQINNESKVTTKFESEYKNIEVLVFSEKGQYIGLSYSTHSMPSAIALSESENSTSIVGWAFDDDYEQTSYMLKIGSDEAAYGARYEVDYSRSYFRPLAGIGFVDRQISDAAIKEATKDSEIKSITGELTWVASLGVDTGYIHQIRWDEYKGIGYSIQMGMRAELYYQGESFEVTDDEKDELYVNMDRFDYNWGPYIQVNAIF